MKPDMTQIRAATMRRRLKLQSDYIASLAEIIALYPIDHIDDDTAVELREHIDTANALYVFLNVTIDHLIANGTTESE